MVALKVIVSPSFAALNEQNDCLSDTFIDWNESVLNLILFRLNEKG